MPKSNSHARTRSSRSAEGGPPRRKARTKGAPEESAARWIGLRLRELRTQKDMSQGDIEERSGLLRCYISRVEGGYTVPSLDTLEKFAAALEVPLHHLFYKGDGEPERPTLRSLQAEARPAPQDPLARQLRKLFSKMDDHGRETLFNIVRKLSAMPE